MSNLDLSQDGALEKLPKSFVQALYHAVTGKTESLANQFIGNVEFHYEDIRRLHDAIRQRMEHYNPVTEPTVTVTIQDHENRTITHSSWEKFSKIDFASFNITSDVTLTVEFLIQLPNTPAPQRFIINIVMDSGLPVISDKKYTKEDSFIWFYSLVRRWTAVKANIEFVDFLVAKTFCTTIEEWFKTLKEVPKSKTASFLGRRLEVLRYSTAHLGRLGAAAFLAGYLWFNGGIGDSTTFAYVIALGLALWAVFQLCANLAARRFTARIGMSTLPSVIIITEGDKRAYDKAKGRIKNSLLGGGGYLATAMAGLALNLLASYIASIWFGAA